MTTLLLTEIFPPQHGGSGRWFWEIYRRLPRDQFLIAAGEHPDQAEFDRGHDLQVCRLPIKFHSWGLLNGRDLRLRWRVLRALRRIIVDHHVEAIHCGKVFPEGLNALLLQCWRRIPFICYVHGEEVNMARSSRELTWWTHRMFRRASLVIANSHNTAAKLREDWRVPEDRLRVLHPGVDTEAFVPAPRSALVRARLGWADRPVVLTVGRLQKRKGHDQLILALRRIKETNPDILYAIVGDGEERQFLRELAIQHQVEGNVQFMGETEDKTLLECYQQCDLFALPNRQIGHDFEGFGMVLLEAQACGRPVLAGTSGGTAETMQVPQTGRLIPCEGSEQLAETIIALLADRAGLESMGAAGRQWVVDKFDWGALSVQAAQIFHHANQPMCAAQFSKAWPICNTGNP